MSADLHAEVERLKEAVSAATYAGAQWENDYSAVAEALGEPITDENSDCAINILLERIEVLKHIAIEVAAYGDCGCESGKGDCVYCLACAVSKETPVKGPEAIKNSEKMLADFLLRTKAE